jgi:elongation factor Ts
MPTSTEQIKELREKTGAGIMECKRALDEAGTLADAEKLLKQWGLATAEKKAGREASQGVIESYVHAGSRIGSMIELNCETDFVARTDDFKKLAREIAMQVAAIKTTRISAQEEAAADTDGDVPLLDQPYIRDSSKTVQDLLNETIARLRENIVVRRFARFELGGL